MANTRRGKTRGYNGQKGGAHQIAWDKDPIILARVQAGANAWARMQTAIECLAYVNNWLAEHYPDEPPVGIDTIYEDRRRAVELRKRETVNQVEANLATLDLAVSKGWEAYENADDPSLAERASMLRTIGTLTGERGKLDGTAVNRTQISAHVTTDGSTPAIPEMTVAEFAEATAVLYSQSEEFRRAFDAHLRVTGRVVDVEIAEVLKLPPPADADDVIDFLP